MKYLIVLVLLSGCVNLPDRSRFQYTVEKSGELLISTSPTFDKPVVVKEKKELKVQQGWLLKNDGRSSKQISTKDISFSIKEQSFAPKCSINGKPELTVNLDVKEKVLLECEVILPSKSPVLASDQKGVFTIPIQGESSITSSILLKAEDFE